MFEIILKKTFAIKYGENPSNHVSSKVFLSIWAHNIFWNFSYPKSKYQGCHIVKIEIEIKNIKLCLVFTHFHDIFIKILFFFQKQLSGWPYLIRPSVEFHNMYLILKDFVLLLKRNQICMETKCTPSRLLCAEYEKMKLTRDCSDSGVQFLGPWGIYTGPLAAHFRGRYAALVVWLACGR